MILWSLLTGRRKAWADAFDRIPLTSAIITRVTRGERPDCSAAALRADAPAAVVDLMKRMWDQQPTARPSPLEIVVELDAAISAASAFNLATHNVVPLKHAVQPALPESDGFSSPATCEVSVALDGAPSTLSTVTASDIALRSRAQVYGPRSPPTLHLSSLNDLPA